MNIRLKEPEQVDKFMQRLGIDQLIEETPTLRSAIVDLLSIFLDLVSGEADFLRRIVGNALISSTTPSDKVHMQIFRA